MKGNKSMKWSIVLLFISLLIASGSEIEPDVFSVLDFQEALIQGKQEGKSVLVKFHADWCYYCKKMDREIFIQKKVQDALSDMIVIKVDVEIPDGLNLARKYSVTALPTIIIFNSNGEIVYGRPGFHSSKVLLSVLKEINEKI